jgi:hypothetical protein
MLGLANWVQCIFFSELTVCNSTFTSIYPSQMVLVHCEINPCPLLTTQLERLEDEWGIRNTEFVGRQEAGF